MNEIIRKALAMVSKNERDVKNSYKEEREFKKNVRPYYKSVTCNMFERVLYLDGRDIMTRAYSHTGKIEPLMIFFHGGGFVSGDLDSYSNLCADLSRICMRKVVSVDYRLAPENKFPAAVNDAFDAMQEIITHAEDWYQADPEDIVIVGDSAGATLCCVSTMMARDRGAHLPKKQILVYPAAWCDYRDTTPFESVRENGEGYILTQTQLIDYMSLYSTSSADFENPYFAPLKHTNFTSLPETLVITMEYDPLRDEGEELVRVMREGGNTVWHYRIENGIHGIMTLPPSAPLTRDIFKYIKNFVSDASSELEEQAAVSENAAEEDKEKTEKINAD